MAPKTVGIRSGKAAKGPPKQPTRRSPRKNRPLALIPNHEDTGTEDTALQLVPPASSPAALPSPNFEPEEGDFDNGTGVETGMIPAMPPDGVDQVDELLGEGASAIIDALVEPIYPSPNRGKAAPAASPATPTPPSRHTVLPHRTLTNMFTPDTKTQRPLQEQQQDDNNNTDVLHSRTTWRSSPSPNGREGSGEDDEEGSAEDNSESPGGEEGYDS